jgi:hypothetical protein
MHRLLLTLIAAILFIAVILTLPVTKSTGLFSGIYSGDKNHRAQLRRCDLPEEYLAPDRYIVYLVPGYPLKQHKQLVGDQLPLGFAIEDVLTKSKHAGYACYTTELNATALEIVRADPGVDYIECDSEGVLKEGSITSAG